MKFISAILIIILLMFWKPCGFAQGFVNLNFESANVSGYAQGSDNVPVANALPGWNAYLFSTSGTNALSQIWYDSISLGGPLISIVDTNFQYNPTIPIQGTFSAYLFGGGTSNPYSAEISQAGLVPVGTKSLLFNA